MGHSSQPSPTERPCLRIALAASLAAALLLGCQSSQRRHSDAIAAELAAGGYAIAAARAAAAAQAVKPGDADLVTYLLEAGRTSQIAGDLAASRGWFARVQEILRPYLDEEAEASVREAIATTAVNQTLSRYRGTPSDRMLSAALDAANLLALGEIEAARIELNRAAEWQQDAIEKHSQRIEAALERSRAESRGQRAPELPSANKPLDSRYASHFANLEDLSAYAEFANPFVDHLRGVYSLCFAADAGDRDRARFSFRRVAAMEPRAQPMLLADLEASEGGAREGAPAATWIYFLTGLGPRLEQVRVDLPIPVGPVNYVAAAFPVMRFATDFAPSLSVATRGGGEPVEAVPLADLDRIVGAEFRARLPTIIAQELLSASAKAAATYGLGQAAGDWGKVAGWVYQAVSTSADTRIWRSVPKRILLCRVPTPEDGRLELFTGRRLGEVAVQPGVPNIVLVTLPAASTPLPSIVSIPLASAVLPRAPASFEAEAPQPSEQSGSQEEPPP